MAAKESWKLGPIRLSGQSSSTTAAAQATRRMEIGWRSQITANRATPAMRQERTTGTLAPESRV